MRTSISTLSVADTLEDKLTAFSAAGFDGIEIFEIDFLAFDGSPREVGQMVRDRGLEISLFQPFRDFEGMPEPQRQKTFDRAKRKFELMQDLGAPLMLVCSNVSPVALGGIDRAAADFAELGDLAAAHGIRVGYEALAWGRHINDHRDAWEIVRRADHPNVGLILDSFHTLARKIDVESIRAIPADRIFFVQLADAPAIQMDYLYLSRHFRNMPGEGDLPLIAFAGAVAQAGYTGPYSLEIFNDQFRGSNTAQTARDGYRSLVTLMDDVRHAHPEANVALPDFPPRVPPRGVAFVEFATRDEDARALESLLTTLGFRATAKHKNKDVTIWQQGEIRLILNKEDSGYAASAWTARGTTVCDIGLSVASAGDALARARALRALPFAPTAGPGEMDIPAVRGLSGSLLHFLDDKSALAKVWEVEFGTLPDGDADAGLLRIDHLAQTMGYDDMLSWTLFYTSIFAMGKSPMVDVIDPDGLVRSQVVASPDGALQITLNGADSHRTLAGRMLSETFGAPIQHVALTCRDIFATAEALASRGFQPLPMPDNYYADLAARFGLPDNRIDSLKSLNILYDEDDRGSFFQTYSRAFAGGLFFEIVERQNGYRGFGAPNAPFRIAAQKRLMRPKGMPAH